MSRKEIWKVERKASGEEKSVRIVCSDRLGGEIYIQMIYYKSFHPSPSAFIAFKVPIRFQLKLAENIGRLLSENLGQKNVIFVS